METAFVILLLILGLGAIAIGLFISKHIDDL